MGFECYLSHLRTAAYLERNVHEMEDIEVTGNSSRTDSKYRILAVKDTAACFEVSTPSVQMIHQRNQSYEAAQQAQLFRGSFL